MMSCLRKALVHARAHVFAIVLSVAVGAIYAGPNIYHAFSPGYQGIIMADSGDADFYLTVINKSYDSPGPVGDPFQYEYRDNHNPFQFFLIEFLLGRIGKIFNLSIDVLWTLCLFVFPAVLTVIIYSLAYSLTKRRSSAFVVAAAMLLGTELVHPNGISNMLQTFLFQGGFREFLMYSRPVNPQVSALFFFLSLWALFNLLRNPVSKKAMFFAGLSVGVLAYVYPYYWAFAAALLGVMVLYTLVMRNWQLLKGLCGAGVVTLLSMLPFLIMNFAIFVNGSGSGLTQAIPTHRVIVEKVILLPLAIYALIFLWARYKGGVGRLGVWTSAFAQKYLFVLLLLLAGVVVSNHQVITGRMFYQQHFHFFTNIPLFVLAMTLLGMEILALFPKLLRTLAACCFVLVCAWFAVGVQVSSYRGHSEESTRFQKLAPIFAFVRAQYPATPVIASDNYLWTRQTIYTQAYAYGSGGYDVTFNVPRERIIHDYFVTLAILGVKAEEVRDYMYQKNNREILAGSIFIGTYWRDLCGAYSCFPDSVIEDLVPAYKDFSSRPLLENLHKYKIDYILWDRVAHPEWQLEGIVEEVPLVESGDFVLYAVKN